MMRDSSAWKRRRRWLYAAGVWLLLAAQVQLIFAAELHQHGYPVIASHQATKLALTASRSRSTSPEGSVCIVCQIVRQGAARAILGGPVFQLSGDVVLRPLPVLRRFCSLPISILPVRAPPILKGSSIAVI